MPTSESCTWQAGTFFAAALGFILFLEPLPSKPNKLTLDELKVKNGAYSPYAPLHANPLPLVYPLTITLFPQRICLRGMIVGLYLNVFKICFFQVEWWECWSESFPLTLKVFHVVWSWLNSQFIGENSDHGFETILKVWGHLFPQQHSHLLHLNEYICKVQRTWFSFESETKPFLQILIIKSIQTHY